MLPETLGHRNFRSHDDSNGNVVYSGALDEDLNGEPNLPVINVI
jgi:hypothetical protein